MKGLYKRGKVYWIDYRANGKRYRESTNTTKRREAEYILACRMKEAKEGKSPEIKKIKKDYKFAELAREYSTWVKQQKGYKSKKTFIRQLVEEYGSLNVNEVSTLIVEKWQTKHLKTHKPATANRKLACLKHMVNKGVDWKMASEETLKQVRKVKYKKENNKRLRYLSIEECQTLLNCCASHLKPIVTVALHTGMRRGEILGLKWEQVDLKHGFILLDTTKNGGRREIPIDRTLEEMFNEMPHSIESVYVFTDRNGNPYKEVTHSYGSALKKAGIRDFRFHDLRHNFASHLVMQGIDLTSVKELLGHASLSMTMRYSHLSPSHKRKAVNTLDRLLSDSQTVGCDQDVSKTIQNSLK